MLEPQEGERFRLALPPPRSLLGGKLAELGEAGLLRVQAQCVLGQAFFEINQETLRILSVLEADDGIVGVAHDDHVAGSVAFAPLLDPEIVNIKPLPSRRVPQ